MASEPTDESVSLSLPPDLAEWVDQQAAAREADRETVLLQLLAAHRAAADAEDVGELGSLDGALDTPDVEDEVRAVIAERMSDIAGAVADQLDVERQVEDAVEAKRAEITQAAADRASQRTEDAVSGLEADFMGKLDDVRDRVVQVKKEADRKAPADHDHPDLADRVGDLAESVEDLESEVADLQETTEGRFEGQEDRLDDLDETVADLRDKLETVAYVVRDLRDGNETEDKRAASVERIKRSAAELDLDRARCEACGEGVEVALMTDPECPHCEATVTHVEAGKGIFGKPTLKRAQGIEAARDGDEDDG